MISTKIYTQILMASSLVFCIYTGKAQTKVDTTLSSAITAAGSVNATHSITFSPGFSVNGANGAFTASIFIPVVNCIPLAAIPSPDQNYIITFTPRTAISDATQLVSMNTCQVMQGIQYMDGLGRPLQTVQVKGSPSGLDIIQPAAYDAFGRDAAKYLPYTTDAGNAGSYRSNALSGAQSTFYAAPPSGVTAIPNPYAVAAYEISPLNRTVEQGAPGDAWQLTGTVNADGVASGHTVKIVYGNNDAASLTTGTGYWAKQYGVTIDATTGARTLADQGTYGVNQLEVSVSYDENWVSGKSGRTETYKDKIGHIVLKRTYSSETQALSTYYVYDDFGNLSFVLPPGASPDAGSITQTMLDNYCYQYSYDERQRQVQKKIPGKGWEYKVYNALDQLIASQDANQRTSNQWEITKYDALGRVVMTGLWNNSNTSIASATLQANNYATTQFDNRDYTSTTTGYAISSYPQTLNSLLAINYYDDYNFPQTNPYPYAVNTTITGMPSAASLRTKAQPTATKTNVLGTSDMLWSVHYYDDKDRLIQADIQHYLGGSLNAANYDQESTGYDFTNAPVQTARNHYKTGSSSPTITIANSYVYDDMGRKKQTFEQINGGTSVLLSQTDYDEVGQLTTKHLHSTNSGASFLQDINYAYNERGWLRTGASTLFSLDLRYNTAGSGTQQYNGNIAEMHYAGANSSKTFDYTYDPINRLTYANSNASGALDETIAYDVMGNITSLARGGTSYGTLGYTYSANQLTAVAGTGFTSRSYGYDPNGNATSDGGTKTINYNILNLPQSLTTSGTTIATYLYDAAGTKLRTTSTADGNWDYVSGILYHNNAISSIQTEDGRATYNGTNYVYQYDLKDHLGDNRVTFDADPTTGAPRELQEDEYYAFGLRHGLYDNSNGNRYLYNGKEVQVDLDKQYDYGARFYDPVIARWTSVDSHADKYYSLAPYDYVANNPLKLVDPNGRDIRPSIDNKNHTITINIRANFRGNVTSERLAEWKQGVGETYSRTLESGKYKGYVVTTNLVATVNQKKDSKYYQIDVLEDPNIGRTVFGANKTFENGDKMQLSKSSSYDDAAHEFGHVLGNDDTYKYTDNHHDGTQHPGDVTESDPGDIMGNYPIHKDTDVDSRDREIYKGLETAAKENKKHDKKKKQ